MGTTTNEHPEKHGFALNVYPIVHINGINSMHFKTNGFVACATEYGEYFNK